MPSLRSVLLSSVDETDVAICPKRSEEERSVADWAALPDKVTKITLSSDGLYQSGMRRLFTLRKPRAEN
ncbi:hypothetical protein SAMN05518861_11775 [Mesorhizobium sp. YR577]|nr:hypothetical protein SAMN05518861_11775 [Mesorhizobium sp. YR577]